MPAISASIGISKSPIMSKPGEEMRREEIVQCIIQEASLRPMTYQSIFNQFSLYSIKSN